MAATGQRRREERSKCRSALFSSLPHIHALTAGPSHHNHKHAPAQKNLEPMLLHCKVGRFRRFIDRRVLFVGNVSGSTCADSTVCSSVHTLALQWTSADSKRFCGGKKQQQQCHRYCEEAEQSEVWSTMSGNAAAVSVVLLPPLLFPPWPHHLPAPSENTAAAYQTGCTGHCACVCVHFSFTVSALAPAAGRLSITRQIDRACSRLSGTLNCCCYSSISQPLR